MTNKQEHTFSHKEEGTITVEGSGFSWTETCVINVQLLRSLLLRLGYEETTPALDELAEFEYHQTHPEFKEVPFSVLLPGVKSQYRDLAKKTLERYKKYWDACG